MKSESRLDALLSQPPTLIADAATVAGLAHNGQPISSDKERRALLEQSLQGAYIELDVTATTSLQPEKPRPLPESMKEMANANFSRFGATGIKTFARSFKGRPFLRDHDRALEARGGKIMSASAVDDDGGVSFVQEIRLVKPWAVQGVLDGTIEMFSVAWEPKGNTWEDWKAAVICTVCNASMFSIDCSHWPGQLTEIAESGERVVVEAEWDSRRIRGKEASAVTFPAVEGTHIGDFAVALAQLKRERGSEKDANMSKLLSALGAEDEKAGLAAIKQMQAAAEQATAALAEAQKEHETALAEATAAVTAAQESVEAASSALAAEKEMHAQTRASLTEARGEVDKTRADKRKGEIDALLQTAMSEGRLRPQHDAEGKPVEGHVERYIRKLGADDIEAARAYVADMPVIDPVGRKLETPTAAPSAANDYGLTEQQKKIADSLGLAYQDYARGGKLPKDTKAA